MTDFTNPNRFIEKYRISSPRLRNWDYSSPYCYFITICTLRHHNFFGKIKNNKVVLSKMGDVAKQCLTEIPKHFTNVCISSSIVMPNHVHMLVNLSAPRLNSVETHDRASLQKRYQSYHFHRLAIKSNQTIPKIISQYKSTVTRIINPKIQFFSWQPRYHDVIVENERQLIFVKNYITNNPINWQKDKYYR